MNDEVRSLIDKLNENKTLERSEWIEVIEGCSEESRAYAALLACEAREPYYGKKVFLCAGDKEEFSIENTVAFYELESVEKLVGTPEENLKKILKFKK